MAARQKTNLTNMCHEKIKSIHEIQNTYQKNVSNQSCKFILKYFDFSFFVSKKNKKIKSDEI